MSADTYSAAEAEAFLQSLANSFTQDPSRLYSSYDDPPAAKKPRRSRWGSEKSKIFVPGIPTFIPPGLAPEALDALLIRLRIEEITFKLTSNQLEIDYSDNRSPSPEPTYNSQGVRTNTREQRTKDNLNKERQKLISLATQMNPLFKPPADYKPSQARKSKKIFIPIEKFPEYNFIGLIIGPRGLTQKTMEKESGAKIAIRGKGSVKDGKGRIDGKYQAGEDEPLHVLLTGETEEQIEKAAIMVEKLLVPIPEERNEHKKNQLRKLAEINGTLRDHLSFSFDKTEKTYDANVTCSICGEASHVSQDCPMKGQGPVDKQKLDEEYESFLAEIGGGGGGGSGSGSVMPPWGAPPTHAPMYQQQQQQHQHPHQNQPPWASHPYPMGQPQVPHGQHGHQAHQGGGQYNDEYNDFMSAISKF